MTPARAKAAEALRRVATMSAIRDYDVGTKRACDEALAALSAEAAAVPADREALANLMEVEADRAQALVMALNGVSTIAMQKRTIAAILRQPAAEEVEAMARKLEHTAEHKYVLSQAMSEPLRYKSTAETFEGKVAALLRRLSPPADGWRPIESAPKDGTRILGWSASIPSGWQKIHSIRWNQIDGTWREPSFGRIEPTHWRPLPTPPSSEEATA